MAEHVDLTDPELHEPKGIASAAADTVYVANGAGSGTFKPFNDFSVNPVISGYEELISQSDFTTQNPSGLNVTTQVTYGPAFGTGADPVSISAAGAITFNEAGAYVVRFRVQMGRTGASGVSLIHIRNKLNGVATADTTSVKLESPEQLFDISFAAIIEVPAATVLTTEIVRDPAGANAGGLVPVTATATGWGTSPSARVRIGRIVNTV